MTKYIYTVFNELDGYCLLKSESNKTFKFLRFRQSRIHFTL